MDKDENDTELLLAEYLKLQDIIEDFDKRALTIKAWSVTLSAAGIITSYVEESPAILAIAAMTALFFWVVEGLWKVNQQCFYGQVWQMERAFRGDEVTVPLQIATQWSSEYRKKKTFSYLWRVLTWPHVAFPHLLLAVLGAGLFLASLVSLT